ncbi:MAG: RraA family protein [Alphaproteobacteria bacterium]|nr:RraA family protein [Alphaproteobacteria bacterium]
MSDSSLDAALLESLRGYDTPTICNGLEIVAPERRAIGFTTTQMVSCDPSLPPIIGYARTATIRAVEPSPLPPQELKEVRLGYYEYVGSEPGPAVPVLQDIDPVPGFGAFWGEVQTNVHKALGCPGAVTNGSIRDLDMLAEGFHLIGGEVGPSHAHVHVVEFGGQVNLYGMSVKHGDLVHADRHGAVVIPHAVAAELPAAISVIEKRESFILEAARSPGFTVDDLRKAMAAGEDIH